MTSIVVTGASNTTNDYASVTYAQLLGTALNATIYNTAVSGSYVHDVLNNINSRILAYSPNITIMTIGMNDVAAASEAGTDNREMINTCMDELQSIITQVLACGSKLIILSLFPSRNISDWQRTVEYTEAQKWLCLKNNVEFIDVHSKFLHLSKSVTPTVYNSYYKPDPDKYHLNDKGHALVADFILNSNVLQAIEAPVAPPAQTAGGTVFTQNCAEAFGNITTKTIRVIVPASACSAPSGTVTKLRLTLQSALDEPITINELYIGVQTSGAACIALVPIRYNGNISYTVAKNSHLITDWVSLSWNKASNLLLSLYCAGGSNSDRLVATTNKPTAVTYTKSGNYAGSIAGSGYTGYNSYLSLISKIETDGF